MAIPAVAQDVVFALRHQIATIEGRLPERLAAPDRGTVLRHAGVPEAGWLRTGVAALDHALGGGLPMAGLTEIHGSIAHDAGAAAGFALALLGLLHAAPGPVAAGRRPPVLWIGVENALAEAGTPYPPGLACLSGPAPGELLIARARRVEDALWIAEEAAGLKRLAAVLLEVHGNPGRLGLTATRRLHRRARTAGRPVLLLRQSAALWPTAAPVRLLVAAAPAAPRRTLAGPLADSLGHPAFAVTLSKSLAALAGQFLLEWNPDERVFQERQPQDPRPVVSLPPVRSDLPAASGAIVAFRPLAARAAAARLQPAGEQHPAHRRPQRAG